MIRLTILLTFLLLTQCAPASDKMDKIPVNISLFRDTHPITVQAYTLGTLMSEMPTGLFTTSLLNLQMEPTTKIHSLFGLTEDQAAARSSVHLISLRIFTRNRSLLSVIGSGLQEGRYAY